MARTRTTKKLAQRIDLNYFKRPTPLKRAKLWLSVLTPLLALVWIGWRGFSGDHRVYSSGRMSKAHAVLEKECAACHLQQAGTFSAKAVDSACLDCHDGPAHHPSETAVPSCSTCHTEHRGTVALSAVSNQACAECHADLRVQRSVRLPFPNIRSFEDGHPEFLTSWPEAYTFLATLKLNHALHMKPIRRTPNGVMVQLECGDCHRPAMVNAAWPYADQRYVGVRTTYTDARVIAAIIPPTPTTTPPRPMNGRELMVPVRFANACAACHLLTFDKRFDEGVPHDEPEVIHAFLVKKFTEYIAVHANELREMRDPDRNLTGKPLPTRARTLLPLEWVTERTAVAEGLLWRKTCAQCHKMMPYASLKDVLLSLSANPGNAGLTSHRAEITATASNAGPKPDALGLPWVASPNIVPRWMLHAKFDHDAHRGFTCVSCHAKALTSTESSDLLIPGIATCKTCHAPGPDHADSRCSECHTYHDWSKRREVTPKFTLPALRTSGH